MFKLFVRLLVVLIMALLMPQVTRTGYPTIITQSRRLAETFHRLYGDMILATGLAGTGKTELDALNAALQVVAADKTNLPNYDEQG